MEKQKKAYFLAILTVLSWSTVATAFKLSLRHLSHIELMLYSSAVAALLLAVVLLATGRMGAVLRSTGKQWFRSFQRIGARDFAGLIVGYLGVVVVATQGRFIRLGSTNPAGVALALGSTVIWALYWIYNTKDSREPVVCLFQSFVCALVPALVYCLCIEGLRAPPVAGLAGAAYVGAFEMSIPFVTWSTALKLSKNTAKIGSLILLSPCISLLFIGAVLGEAVRPSTVAGLLLILAGVLIQRRARSAERGVESA